MAEESFKIWLTGDIYIKNEVDSVLTDELKSIVKEHSLVVCNFEGALETVGAEPLDKTGPHICQHTKAAEILKNDGYNLFNLANNHICDYSEKSLLSTIKALGKENVVGAGVSFEEAYKPKFFIFNNRSLGLLAFGEAEFGALVSENNKGAGFAWINHHKVNQLIADTKKQCDVLIVLAHAGIEQIDYPLPEWRQRYYELVDAGADAVVGCHVHVPQGWELYKEKPIFYSMGNFYFDMQVNHPLWNKGYAVSLNINNSNQVGFDILPIEKKDNKVYLNHNPDFKTHLYKISSALYDKSYNKNLNDICVDLWKTRYQKYYGEAMGNAYYKFGWKDIIALIKNKILNKNTVFHPSFTYNHNFIIHNVRIESHRWAVIRALENLDKKI